MSLYLHALGLIRRNPGLLIPAAIVIATPLAGVALLTAAPRGGAVFLGVGIVFIAILPALEIAVGSLWVMRMAHAAWTNGAAPLGSGRDSYLNYISDMVSLLAIDFAMGLIGLFLFGIANLVFSAISPAAGGAGRVALTAAMALLFLCWNLLLVYIPAGVVIGRLGFGAIAESFSLTRHHLGKTLVLGVFALFGVLTVQLATQSFVMPAVSAGLYVLLAIFGTYYWVVLVGQYLELRERMPVPPARRVPA